MANSVWGNGWHACEEVLTPVIRNQKIVICLAPVITVISTAVGYIYGKVHERKKIATMLPKYVEKNIQENEIKSEMEGDEKHE